jgi:hypothetical protein
MSAPFSSNSRRSPFDRPTTACLLVVYGPCAVDVINPPADDTLTT